MQHPIAQTIQLSKQQKLKQLNDKLNSMLKHKNIDHTQTHLPLNKSSLKTEQTHKTEQTQKKKEEQKEDKKDQKTQKNSKHKMIKKEEKIENKTLRKAAGEVWEDKTMEDWPDNDYRVFCGNLGNEVNDQILASVFRRYASFQMARVVRDRRTGKTKGYGFISFANPTDFLNCLKQMNGKHVGNRPVKLMKSTWQDRELNSQRNQLLPSDFRKNAQKTTHQICHDFKYVSSL